MRMKRARLNNHIESIEQKFNTYWIIIVGRIQNWRIIYFKNNFNIESALTDIAEWVSGAFLTFFPPFISHYSSFQFNTTCSNKLYYVILEFYFSNLITLYIKYSISEIIIRILSKTYVSAVKCLYIFSRKMTSYLMTSI